MRKLTAILCLTLAVLLGSTVESFSIGNERALTFVQSTNFELDANIRDRSESSNCNFKKVKIFHPKHIVLDVTPISITNVDEEKSSFLMNFYFAFEYETPFSAGECEIRRNNLKDVFNPHFEFMNQNEIDRLKPYNIFFNKNKIRVGTKYSAHLQSDFDWTMFPFDTQMFSLDIMHYYTKNELKINFTTDMYDTDTYKINTINWKFSNFEVEHINEVWGGEEYEKIKLYIKMERSNISLLTRIFLPSFFITMLSVSAFFLPLKELESRITLQIASVISLSAFYVVVDQKLPDLPYLTLAGYFILLCFSVSICSIFYTLFQYVARNRGV